MSEAAVSLIHCVDYDDREVTSSLVRQFELLGGIDKFVSRGDSVLVKPNFIAPRSRCHATQTHPQVLLSLAKLLKDFGAKPFIGDSPAWGDVFECVHKLKMEEQLQKLDVPVKQLDKPRKCQIGSKQTNVAISSVALEADKIINVPKFKTHQQLIATFAIKNMFGCVSGKQKAYFHFAKGGDEFEFCQLLVEIYKYLNPVLTIIDGIIAMDGPGPISGRARPLGFLIAGTEPVSCEVICSKLIDIDPMKMPTINAAKRLGFGCWDIDRIKVLGDEWESNICTDFNFAKQIPLRFSLTHVLKSGLKQILLLIKADKDRQH